MIGALKTLLTENHLSSAHTLFPLSGTGHKVNGNRLGIFLQLLSKYLSRASLKPLLNTRIL